MSAGIGVIAGPEVDMAELEADMAALEAASSAALAVDLNLNLGPSFALELGLGGINSEGSATVSRQNWPRFEPGMAGMLQDEVVEEDQSIPRGSLSGASSPGSPLGVLPPPRLRMRRHPRYSLVHRLLRPAVRDPVESQAFDPLESQGSGGSHSPVVEIGPGPLNARSRSAIHGDAVGPVTTNLEIGPASSSESKEAVCETGISQVGVHFECNICLETATEPVVTCCGHLFCWPCLYQWLHVHARQKECPVCKGSLLAGVIIPIYGRGIGKHSYEPQGNIPPRPAARRISAERGQQDEMPEASSFRANRAEGDEQERSPAAAEDVLSRLRVAQRLQREHFDERFRLRLSRRLRTLNLITSRGSNIQPVAHLHSNGQTGAGFSLQEPSNWMSAAGTRLGVGNVAAFDASMEGLRENLANLEHMRRSLEIASSLTQQVGRLVSEEGSSSGLPDIVSHSEAERMPAPRTNRSSLETLIEGSRQDSLRASVSTSLECHRGEASTSGSLDDAETSSVHARKRRRLN